MVATISWAVKPNASARWSPAPQAVATSLRDARVIALAQHFLGPYTEKITLHLTQATTINPGETGQLLHRDREAWGANIPAQIEPQFNTLWAISDFTEDNGADPYRTGLAAVGLGSESEFR